MIVVGGTASKSLAQDLAKELGVRYVQPVVTRFPDEECYVRIEEESLDEVIIVQNTHPDAAFVELLLLLDAALGLGARKITAVVPYFGYSRQDERFKKGEALSAKVMIDQIGLTADRLVTVDVHKPYILDWFKNKGAADVHGAPCIGQFFKGHGIDLVLAPDEGAAARAQEVAKVVGADWDYLEKTRLSGEVVRIAPKNIDVKEKHTLIVDDIISTGGTIEAAANQLKIQGAKSIAAACIHGLFARGALDRLRKCCNQVFSTNTIEGEVSVISVAPQVAKALRQTST